MPRSAVLFAGLFAASFFASSGCQSCSSCHDYDPPVAGCNCDACGTHRSGSVSGCGCSGCSGGDCAPGYANGGCNCGNQGGYVDGGYEDSYPAEGSYSAEGMAGEQPMPDSGAQP